MKCKNCGSYMNSWFPSNRVNSVAVDGRLKSNEISCDFVLGCDMCSETLRVVPAEEIASQLNAGNYLVLQNGRLSFTSSDMEGVKRVLKAFKGCAARFDLDDFEVYRAVPVTLKKEDFE